MEAEISMRMQKVTFLLCVTLDHSLIPEAGSWGGGRRGWRFSGGMGLISQNALCLMHNLNSLPPFCKRSYSRLFCLFAG